jgi:POLQ-like helicase
MLLTKECQAVGARPIPQDPARLFTLSIGMLGDLAARSQNGDSEELLNGLRDNLQFSARFFDSYIQTRLNPGIDPYVMLLSAASFYLCDLPGSSVVMARQIGDTAPDIGGEGLENLLRWLLQGNLIVALDPPAGTYGKAIGEVSAFLRRFFTDGSHADNLLALCTQLCSEERERERSGSFLRGPTGRLSHSCWDLSS